MLELPRPAVRAGSSYCRHQVKSLSPQYPAHNQQEICRIFFMWNCSLGDSLSTRHFSLLCGRFAPGSQIIGDNLLGSLEGQQESGGAIYIATKEHLLSLIYKACFKGVISLFVPRFWLRVLGPFGTPSWRVPVYGLPGKTVMNSRSSSGGWNCCVRASCPLVQKGSNK